MNSLHEVLGPVLVLGVLGYILKVMLDHREKMRLIKNGADMPKYESTKTFFSWLKIAGLFIGFAVGILIGNLLAEMTILAEEIAYFSMVFLFGGISVFVTNFFEKRGKL
jgi:uncharacterized protein DUF6249